MSTQNIFGAEYKPSKREDYLMTANDIESLIKAADRLQVQNYLQASVVSAHGRISISKFIRVPPNTIIVNFVTDGKLYADYDLNENNAEKGIRNIGMNFIFIWMRSMLRTIAVTKKFDLNKLGTFMQKLTEDLEGYRVHFPFLLPTQMVTFDQNFIMYRSGDLIPEQSFSLQDVTSPGIYEWTAALRSSKRTKTYEYIGFPEAHPLHAITTKIDEKRKISLHDMLDFMHENTRGKSNIVFVQACRTLNIRGLGVHTEKSFLYKNLLHQYNYMVQQLSKASTAHSIPKRKHTQNIIKSYKTAFLSFVKENTQYVIKEYNDYHQALSQYAVDPSLFLKFLSKVSDKAGTRKDFLSIFYEYICVLLSDESNDIHFLIYYSDAIELPRQPLGGDFIGSPIPVRYTDGSFVDIGLSPLKNNSEEWINAIFKKASPQEVFYLPDNAATKFTMRFVESNARHTLWPLQVRSLIFRTWWRCIKPYLYPDKDYLSGFQNIVHNYFVDGKDYQVPNNEKNTISAAFALYAQACREDSLPFHVFYSGAIIFKSRSKQYKFLRNYSRKETIRDLSFPYLTPTEFGLANFVFDEASGKFFVWSQLLMSELQCITDNHTFSDIDASFSKEIVKSLQLNSDLSDEKSYGFRNFIQGLSLKQIRKIPLSTWKKIPLGHLLGALNRYQINALLPILLTSENTDPLVTKFKHAHFYCDRLGLALVVYKCITWTLPNLTNPLPLCKIPKNVAEKLSDVTQYNLIDIFTNNLYSTCFKHSLATYKRGQIESHRGLTVMNLNYCLNNKEYILRKHQQSQKKTKSKS